MKKDILTQINTIQEKMEQVREINGVKEYRTLSDSYYRFVKLHTDRYVEREVCESVFNFLKTEISSVVKNMTNCMEGENYKQYHDWTISYEKLIAISDHVDVFLADWRVEDIRETREKENKNILLDMIEKKKENQ